jgi:sortase A
MPLRPIAQGSGPSSGQAPATAPGQSPQSSVFHRLQPRQQQRHQARAPRRSPADVLLLIVEVAAVLAVIVVLVRSFRLWRELLPAQPATPAAASALAQSPELSSIAGLLPDAHDSPGDSTVPANLRSLVKPMPAMPLPTAAPGRPSRLVIPKISVQAPVVEGDGAEQLKMGVGHHAGTANPGQRGNMVLSGHNDVYGELFRDLDKLDAGDEITVYSGAEAFRYVVRQKVIVAPDDLTPLQPSDAPVVTLISCYPYLIDTHRIVIIAELAN